MIKDKLKEIGLREQGVYVVWTGRDYSYCYIGSGFLHDRISGNGSKLRNGTHANKMLQEAFNETGEHKIEILEVCKSKEEAREMENIYIEHYKMLDDVVVCNKAKANVNKLYKRVLTEDDVRVIKEMIEEDYTNKEIAEFFCINSANVSKIRTGYRWSKVV